MSVPGFTYVSPLGKGKFGFVAVYKDQDDKLFTIKTVTADNSQREVETLLYIKSKCDELSYRPNVLYVDRIIRNNLNIHIVSEYYPNSISLDKYVMDVSYQINTLFRILREIAEAIQFVHSIGVCHRDIKGANVVIVDNHAILIDFGSACRFEEPSLGLCKGVTGTPNFIAPELGSYNVDYKKADIYSFGVLIYKILSNKYPYDLSAFNTLSGPTLIKETIYAKNRLTPTQLHSEYSMINNLVNRMIDKKPINRPGLDEIIQVLGHQSVLLSTSSFANDKISITGNEEVVRGFLLMAHTRKIVDVSPDNIERATFYLLDPKTRGKWYFYSIEFIRGIITFYNYINEDPDLKNIYSTNENKRIKVNYSKFK